MTPVIRIPDSTYDRLKKIAEPFVDSPADVICRLLDNYEQIASVNKPGALSDGVAVMQLGAGEAPPSLRHTRVKEIRVNGKTVTKPAWNSLVWELHRVALKKLGSFDSLQGLTKSNIKPGPVDEHGFHFRPDLGFSIQNADADHSWRYARHLAEHIKASVEVTFEWMKKDQAAHPGSRARFILEP